MKTAFAILQLVILILPPRTRLDAAASSGGGAGADEAQTDLPARLAHFDATVLAPQERKAAARMVEENGEGRLRGSNERSSAEWTAITNRAQWERFRTEKLAALRNSLGQPATPVPLRQRVTGNLSGEGYRIENVVFQSRPGFWITANLYRPDKPRPSMPGIVISHAHHTPKEHGELQDMGVTWARAGCLVLVPDHPGHGERRQHPFRSAADFARPFQLSRQDYFFRYDAGIQLHLAGESLIGWIARDLMRGVDLLLAQENIDPERIILLGALLGNVEPPAKVDARNIGEVREPAGRVLSARIVLKIEPSMVVPVLLLKLEGSGADKRAGKPPVIVAVSQAGKQRLLREHASEIAALLHSGMAVCLPDVRGTGETSSGTSRGRRSDATSLSSSELMLGGTMPGAQLRDLRAVLAWLRTRDDLDARHLSLWGDSLTPPNPPDSNFQVPRDDDDALPRSPEPLGGLLALLAALYEEDVRSVYVHGGLASFESVLTKHLALIPHDAVVPGALTAGDLCDVVAALAPRPVRLEGIVDGWNRTLSATDLASAYESAAADYRAAGAAMNFSFSPERTS